MNIIHNIVHYLHIVLFKNIVQSLNIVQYLAEGFARIFSPDKDEYPEIGIQPFEGEIYQTSEVEL